MLDTDQIFKIKNEGEFRSIALELFSYQYENCPPYRHYVDSLGMLVSEVTALEDIPFLPIEVFKNRDVYCCGDKIPEVVFTSSGTTGMVPSRHPVADLGLYEKSFRAGFQHFYGSPKDMNIYALLPGYLERQGSSLVYMADKLIGECAEGGFFLYEQELLAEKLKRSATENKKTLLLGVSFALLDMVEKFKLHLPELIVMETGGMKGQRREISREELHQTLCEGFGVQKIHSEYGMTELLSQGYSTGDGIFETPPWMRIMIRDLSDPLSFMKSGKAGGINIIDLANVHSCSFIETQDCGVSCDNQRFEVHGRISGSMLRGCNMLIEE